MQTVDSSKMYKGIRGKKKKGEFKGRQVSINEMSKFLQNLLHI